MKKDIGQRLKVEKNINKKAMLLKLSFNFFFIYIGIVMASLSILAIELSGKTVFLMLVLDVIAYMLVQFLDRSDFLEDVGRPKLPGSLENDLYRLKNENSPIVKKSGPAGH